jgi:hypothetical protein
MVGIPFSLKTIFPKRLRVHGEAHRHKATAPRALEKSHMWCDGMITKAKEELVSALLEHCCHFFRVTYVKKTDFSVWLGHSKTSGIE